MSIHTWSCGTPKSQNNAFTLPPKHTPLTKGQIDYKVRILRESVAERTAQVLKKNRDTFVITTQASKDRTAAITGKSIYLGRTL
jgi:hypothetical protein